MIGDVIHFKEKYLVTSKAIINLIENDYPDLNYKKIVLVVAGESGTGKTVTSYCLQKYFNEKNIQSYVIYQDDYFFHPPLSNHLIRLKDIEHVGMQEVNLELIQNHIDAFKANEKIITKPLVYYNENTISEETVNIEDYQVLIVEGTYSLSLTHFDIGIFMDRTYIETKEQRVERARDENSDFIEKVLAIEHQIIRPYRKKAMYIVKKDYSVTKNLDYEV